MRLSAFTTIFAALLSALPMARPAAVERRQVIVWPAHGTTISPANGSTIAAGDSFQFLYKDSNFCESDVVTVAVYLSQTPPANSDVMANGRLADGTFEYYFGDYTISNFGLPPSSNAPPSSLTMPVLEGTAANTTLYFSVLEDFTDCPPNGQSTWFGIEATTVLYV
ncbi:hypothetical protein BD310DRAFT_856871 [Dichomitus squalens]|uniref:Ubiquitin 3 binding protein But2 C-terminal domain-containing protein n=1 Tax=Dichomitus squalens TaxID=114155 RepID=A0A4Q9PMJ1_9APHY|nr:hypothetical protein BD310DRAFT_856871 [Dichomitus squalens]